MHRKIASVATALGYVAAAAIVTGGASAVVQAHFKLVEPASWLVEDQRGDPQKLAPCGSLAALPANAPATAAPIVLSNAISKAIGGSKLHLKVQETIYHPGHYRVALAVNSREELPADPMTIERTTERGPMSVWAAIQSPPQLPVLADGLFQHYTRPAAAAPGTTAPPLVFETDIQLPNINCAKCTLQVLQFMAEHAYNQPGGYSYHHCADLQITADPAKPIDKGWPTATVSMAR
jgi:hypothetical protein